MEGGGVPLDPRLEVQGDFTAAGGQRAAAELFTGRRPPTAIFAESDEMAFGAIRTLSRLGLRVPEDVSVIGFDDHPLAEVFDLTTISQAVAGQGRAVARQLVSALVGGHEADGLGQFRACTSIVVRGTTAVAASSRRPPSGARNQHGHAQMAKQTTGLDHKANPMPTGSFTASAGGPVRPRNKL